MEILLGNGWYKGRFGLGLVENNYGDRFGCVMELHVEYADGTKQVFVTDETWQYLESFVTQSGIYDGETQDYVQAPGAPRPVALLEMDAPLTDCKSTYKKQPKFLFHTALPNETHSPIIAVLNGG